MCAEGYPKAHNVTTKKARSNSVWLLATLVGAVALIHCVVIPREEQYLERKFGAPYLDYKASVRRWL